MGSVARRRHHRLLRQLPEAWVVAEQTGSQGRLLSSRLDSTVVSRGTARQLAGHSYRTVPRSVSLRLRIYCLSRTTNSWGKFISIFTARCHASAVLAMGLCLCLSVSVTSRSSTKTAKHRITQTTPHDSPGTLVFFCQRSLRNSTGVTPDGGAECRWGGSKSATFDK